MIVRASVFVGLMAASLFASAADGLISLKSPHSAQATMDRLEAVVEDKGMNVFARIDHAAGAEKTGQSLRPTELLIFGNPKGGTPLMQCAQSAGIDLPMKALVWEDETGQVWLGYNEPAYLAERHGAGDCAVVPKLSKALEGMSKAAVAKRQAAKN